MTTHDKHSDETQRLLERILDAVESTEDKIDSIASQIDEYLDLATVGRSWYGNGHAED